jgi:hypothetical protein
MMNAGDDKNSADTELNERGKASEQFQNVVAPVADAPFSEFKAHAEQHLWDDRIGKGYRKRGRNHALFVFGYVHEVYGGWIERGVRAGSPLTIEDFRSADKPLFRRLNLELKRREMPDWLYLPLNKGAEPPISLEDFQAKLAGVPGDLQLMRPPYKPSRYILELRARYGE